MIKINKEERITFRVNSDEKKEINVYANKKNISVSEFIYETVFEKMQLNKLNESQNQFVELFDVSFKKVFESYFKQLMLVLNKIEFNTRWSIKQQDIFMQHLKIPQTKEDLITSILPHPITEKSQEMVLKEIRQMSSRKRDIENE